MSKMRFADLTTALQAMRGVSENEQENVRQLWRDANGDSFVEEVVGGHREKLERMAEATEAAERRQEANAQARQENDGYLGEARARDGILGRKLEELQTACEGLQKRSGELVERASKLAGPREESCRERERLESQLHDLESRVGALS